MYGLVPEKLPVKDERGRDLPTHTGNFTIYNISVDTFTSQHLNKERLIESVTVLLWLATEKDWCLGLIDLRRLHSEYARGDRSV